MPAKNSGLNCIIWNQPLLSRKNRKERDYNVEESLDTIGIGGAQAADPPGKNSKNNPENYLQINANLHDFFRH